MTSRSPYLLSVLNMGASVLTSHRYLQYSVQYSTGQYNTWPQQSAVLLCEAHFNHIPQSPL